MERWREKGWDKQREREMKQRYREKERKRDGQCLYERESKTMCQR